MKDVTSRGKGTVVAAALVVLTVALVIGAVVVHGDRRGTPVAVRPADAAGPTTLVTLPTPSTVPPLIPKSIQPVPVPPSAFIHPFVSFPGQAPQSAVAGATTTTTSAGTARPSAATSSPACAKSGTASDNLTLVLDGATPAFSAHCLYANEGSATLTFINKLISASSGLPITEELALFLVGPPGTTASTVPLSDSGATLVTPTALDDTPVTRSLAMAPAGTYLVAPVPSIPGIVPALLTVTSR